ncbi:MAG: alpha/beta fold hydrolase [Planctomycetes bacterium]|nr:alpha/beta fold hydrolase [Planctomycetota bacterium]
MMIDDVDLNFAERGAGRPLLLVHAFPLDHRMWRGQVEDLSEEYRVIAPDLRGFGGSGVTAGTVAMERFADDLAGLLDRLGIDEPIAMGGLSMGGYVAWQFWRRHARRVSHLILCDTRAAADSEEAARQRCELADQVEEQGAPILVPRMIPRLFSEKTRRQQTALVQAAEQVIRQGSPAGLAAALRGMAKRVDATCWLREIDVPALVLCGHEDVISPVSEMQAIADAMPRAEFVVIPGCGHLAPLEDPVHTNKAIRAFLKATW